MISRPRRIGLTLLALAFVIRVPQVRAGLVVGPRFGAEGQIVGRDLPLGTAGPISEPDVFGAGQDGNGATPDTGHRVSARAAQADLVLNGGFEAGDFSNWIQDETADTSFTFVSDIFVHSDSG